MVDCFLLSFGGLIFTIGIHSLFDEPIEKDLLVVWKENCHKRGYEED